MYKLLLGTTALVAAASLTTAVSAADKIKMGVGGYFQVAIAAGDTDEDDRRDHLVTEEGEIIFNGSTTLDNGLQVGVQVQLEAETCQDQIDEHFMWLSGGFGRVQLGAENSAPYLMGYASPAASHWAHGLNSPNFSHTRIFLTTQILLSSDSEKLTYFTPRISGFQLGVSYTPENDEAGSGPGYNGAYSGFPSDVEPGEQGEIIEVGINYVNKFGDVNVNLSGGYAAGSLEEASATVFDDQTQYNFGAQISMAGFTVGGAYKIDDRGIDSDRTDYNIGVRYSQGPWGVGIQYAHAEVDEANDEVDALEVGGSYAFGPGMVVSAGVQFWDVDADSGAISGGASEGDSTILFLATSVSF
jgi:predicted porin